MGKVARGCACDAAAPSREILPLSCCPLSLRQAFDSAARTAALSTHSGTKR
jgi:hypothetical protein